MVIGGAGKRVWSAMERRVCVRACVCGPWGEKHTAVISLVNVFAHRPHSNTHTRVHIDTRSTGPTLLIKGRAVFTDQSRRKLLLRLLIGHNYRLTIKIGTDRSSCCHFPLSEVSFAFLVKQQNLFVRV